ncbi:hypothetical protein E2L06_17645 [Haloterrigena sp. H1]|uniref:hypothetical protein n=1 Tax=Haloterrigena sp. H1 TaxID=2552943 RepID=UPI00110DBA1C|nr:hypothetical protein [Haloterrigena sp. H1]TMT81735.1 hypothetical protein E2L06_17645 [Haloterrigena sp. H1]
MGQFVESLPSKPLTKSEVLSMNDAREYCIRPESDEALIIALLGNNQVHALGFDTDTDQWVRIYSTEAEYSDEAFDEFEAEIYKWAEAEYGTRLDEEGDLKMSGPSDPRIGGTEV